MRARFSRSSYMLGSALAVAALAAPVVLGVVTAGPSRAQTAAAPKDAPKDAGKDAPKQIALSQAKIDSLVAAQKKVQEVENKNQPKDGAKDAGKGGDQIDAKTQKEIEGVITSSGFASMKDFADTMYSVGMVLSGIDPDGNEYIGTVEALKKEEAQVKADKKMPANEKKEVLDEIAAGIKNAPTEKPLPGNVEIVKANMTKLDQGQKAD